MYCVNCGKEIIGNIPICKECALKVILNESKGDELKQKIVSEAEVFSINTSDEETNTKPIHQPIYNTPPQTTYQANVRKSTAQEQENNELKHLLSFFGKITLIILFIVWLLSLILDSI